MQESFSLWGRPVLGSLEAELSARAQALHSIGGEGGDPPPADRVDGLIYFGTGSDRESVTAGRFSLLRLTDGEENDGEEKDGFQP